MSSQYLRLLPYWPILCSLVATASCSTERSDQVIAGAALTSDVNLEVDVPVDATSGQREEDLALDESGGSATEPDLDVDAAASDPDAEILDLLNETDPSLDSDSAEVSADLDVTVFPEIADPAFDTEVDAEQQPESSPEVLNDLVDITAPDTDVSAPVEVVQPPVCLAGQPTCLVGAAAVCNSNGTGWLAPTACPDEHSCKAGKCLPMICKPNMTICSGDILNSCTPDGLSLAGSATDCAASGLLCKAGQCVSPPCGNSTLDPGEACDDGNKVNGDGCSAGCESEWKLVLSENFDAPALSWTPCAGCSGGGCPSTKLGSLKSGGDWTRVCIPVPQPSAAYKLIRFEFKVHGEVPLGAFWIAAGPLDEWTNQSPRIAFDAVGGGVTLAGKGVKSNGLLDFVPGLPFTAVFQVEINVVAGTVAVGISGQPLKFIGTIQEVKSGPWVWNVATNYACCNGSLVATWMDEFKMFTVAAGP